MSVNKTAGLKLLEDYKRINWLQQNYP